jgi:renalase
VNTPLVAIIGAGMAGLACATRLRRAGIQTRVFEKSRGVGGRMSTRRGEDWQCDHGAQYFTVTDPAFEAQVQRWHATGDIAPWKPRLGALDVNGWSAPGTEVTRYVGTPRMSAPLRRMAEPLSISTRSTVSGLRRGLGGWHLSTAEHGESDTTFSAVLLAVPPTQAEPLLRAHAPTLATLAAEISMAPCWTLMLRLDRPSTLAVDAAFINHGPLGWISRETSKPGRGLRECWVLHATPEWSQAHLEADVGVVCEQLVAAFVAIGGTLPAELTAHLWRYARGGTVANGLHGWDAQARLGLCGDWLAGGRVEGAWQSGDRLGTEVVAACTHTAARG